MWTEDGWLYLAVVIDLNSRKVIGWSSDPFERSLAERWMDWELASLQPDFLDLFWGWYRTAAEHRDPAFITKSAVCCENRFHILDSHLATNRFVAGDLFSMGDIAVATCLYRYFEMGIPTPEIPHVRRWYQKLCERKAYQKQSWFHLLNYMANRHSKSFVLFMIARIYMCSNRQYVI